MKLMFHKGSSNFQSSVFSHQRKKCSVSSQGPFIDHATGLPCSHRTYTSFKYVGALRHLATCRLGVGQEDVRDAYLKEKGITLTD